MKTVLIIGDSLTHGARPDREERHARADRWPNVLRAGLDDDVEIIVEALNGRTTVHASPVAPFQRSAAEVLPMLLHSHAPLDLAIILLGTNDILVAEMSAKAARWGIKRLVETIRHHPCYGGVAAPDILVVAPPHCHQDSGNEIPQTAKDDITRLAPEYLWLSQSMGFEFFDAATVCSGALPDGVHLDAAGSRALGAALVPVVSGMLSR